MKALIWYGAMAVVVTVAGQNEIHNGSRSSSSYIQTSKLVGRKVKSSEGKEIGVIKDVVIDSSNGCMAYTVLSTGGGGTGVISGGGKIVAVPWAVYSRMSDLSVLTVNVDRDKIYNAPAFCQSWRSGFICCTSSWNQLTERKTFGACSCFFPSESVRGFKRETFTKNNTERNWYSATDGSRRNTITNDD